MKRRMGRRDKSLVHLLRERATKGDLVARRIEREEQTTHELVSRLGLYKVLEGHEGCVNCLCWNKDGSLLASSSDDQSVILWNGSTGGKVGQLSTAHRGNVFSVNFLPDTRDRFIVTGAQDSRVCLLDVEAGGSVQSAALHVGRVKRLAVSPDTSGVFWSAAEDGLVMQWDTREQWREGDANVLINLVSHSGKAEVKCIAVNPTQPELLAIGANDPYVRIYDRRKLSLKKMVDQPTMENLTNIEKRMRLNECAGKGDDTAPGAVQYFVPGHLPGVESKLRSVLRPLAVTYLAYSANGADLVVNVGGEHVYCYDKFSLYSGASEPSMMETLAVIENCDRPALHRLAALYTPHHSDIGDGVNSPHSNGRNGSTTVAPLPPSAQELKLAANSEFEQKNYNKAIELYNRGIYQHPHPILFGNRAAALIKRNYSGDMYAAARDCCAALALDPAHVKCLLRLARCLHELDWFEEAEYCLQVFKAKYPEHTAAPAYSQLLTDLEQAKLKRQSDTKEEVEKPKPRSRRRPPYRMYTRQDFLRGQEPPPDTGEAQILDSDDSDDDDDMEVVDGGDAEDEGIEETGLPLDFDGGGASKRGILSDQEKAWRSKARDYTSRFLGACNITTDIKEANFFGAGCQFVCAGSDDGKVLIWDTATSNLVRVLTADNNTVNCVQAHPVGPMLASSGIDPVIRLWAPLPEDGEEEECLVKDMEKVVRDNQSRMTQDPFEYFINIQPQQEPNVQCRAS